MLSNSLQSDLTAHEGSIPSDIVMNNPSTATATTATNNSGENSSNFAISNHPDQTWATYLKPKGKKTNQQYSIKDYETTDFNLDSFPPLNSVFLGQIDEVYRKAYFTALYEKQFLDPLNDIQQKGHLNRMAKVPTDMKSTFYRMLNEQDVSTVKLSCKDKSVDIQQVLKKAFEHQLTDVLHQLDAEQLNLENLSKKLENEKTTKTTTPENTENPQKNTENTENYQKNTELDTDITSREHVFAQKSVKVLEAKIFALRTANLMNSDDKCFLAVPSIKEIESNINLKDFLLSIVNQEHKLNNETIQIDVEEDLPELLILSFKYKKSYENVWEKVFNEHFTCPPTIISADHQEEASIPGYKVNPFSRIVTTTLMVTLNDNSTPTRFNKTTETEISILSHLKHCGYCKTTSHSRFECPSARCANCGDPEHNGPNCYLRKQKAAIKRQIASEMKQQTLLNKIQATTQNIQKQKDSSKATIEPHVQLDHQIVSKPASTTTKKSTTTSKSSKTLLKNKKQALITEDGFTVVPITNRTKKLDSKWADMSPSSSDNENPFQALAEYQHDKEDDDVEMEESQQSIPSVSHSDAHPITTISNLITQEEDEDMESDPDYVPSDSDISLNSNTAESSAILNHNNIDESRSQY